MMDSFNEDTSVVQQQTGIDPTIREINEERTNEEAVDLDHPRGPEDEISADPDEIVAEKSISGKFNSLLAMGKTRKQGLTRQSEASNPFKNILSFGKSGNSENNLNESSTDAGEGNNPDGPQDPDGEENNPGGIQPKTSFFGGIKNALPFGKTPGLTESSTGTAGGPNQTRATADRTTNGSSRTQQQDSTDFATISGGFNNKKTLANGLMDFAFLTANANQLYYAVASRNSGNERVVSIALISTSIFLQIVAGILLICSSYIQSIPVPSNDNNQQDATTNSEDAAELYKRRRTRWLNLIDHWTIALVFIIAITNIFIAAFSTTSTPSIDPPTDT
ncbi:putative Ninjurin A alpha [Daphnia magna]|uniref:Putative Ninjurin a n=1 Tax=Daphnia magna TaxID=35525 RepID=A0A0P4YR48_9CRUS|nr:putative Ninjurin A alpha [Daphnia magna]